MKKIIAMLLVCLTLFSLTACGKTETPEAAPQAAPGADAPQAAAPADDKPVKDKVTIAIGTEAGTTNPVGTTGDYTDLSINYMEPLLEFNRANEITWKLATDVEIIADDEYVYTLREGVTFNNGNPFTAEDVLFSLYLYRDTPTRNSWVRAMDWERTEIIDDYHIRICYAEVLASQYPAGISAIYIMDAESYDEKVQATMPIGTGPYVVTEYIPNNRTLFEARPDYWGEQPKIKNVEVLVMSENSQKTNALESGTIDFAEIAVADSEYLASQGFNVQYNIIGNAVSIDFDCSEGSPFYTKEARYAVAYAINNDAINQLVYEGKGGITDWPASTGAIDYDPRFGGMHDIYVDYYNPEKAKALAEEAGLIGQTLTVMTNGTEPHNLAAQVMQENLKAIGIELNIVSYDAATYLALFQDIESPDWDMVLFNTGAVSNLAIHSLGNWLVVYPSGWSGEERDALWQQGRDMLAIVDMPTRTEAMLDSGYVKNWATASPWYSMVDIPIIFAANPDLKGIEHTGANYLIFSELYW